MDDESILPRETVCGRLKQDLQSRSQFALNNNKTEMEMKIKNKIAPI